MDKKHLQRALKYQGRLDKYTDDLVVLIEELKKIDDSDVRIIDLMYRALTNVDNSRYLLGLAIAGAKARNDGQI